VDTKRVAEARKRITVSACPNCVGNFSKHTKAMSIEELIWSKIKDRNDR
jgi:hypothetical protein